MHGFGGASGDVLARGPGFPPDRSPHAPPSPPVSTLQIHPPLRGRVVRNSRSRLVRAGRGGGKGSQREGSGEPIPRPSRPPPAPHEPPIRPQAQRYPKRPFPMERTTMSWGRDGGVLQLVWKPGIPAPGPSEPPSEPPQLSLLRHKGAAGGSSGAGLDSGRWNATGDDRGRDADLSRW